MTDDQKAKIEKLRQMLQNQAIESLNQAVAELSANISKVDFAKKVDFEKIIVEKVISELPNRIKAEIDWDKMPEQKELDLTPMVESQDKTTEAIKSIKIETKEVNLNPLTKALKAVETIIEQLGKTIISTLSRILFFLSEPDDVVIEDDRIIEMYGDRSVLYKIKRNSKGRIAGWTRNES